MVLALMTSMTNAEVCARSSGVGVIHPALAKCLHSWTGGRHGRPDHVDVHVKVADGKVTCTATDGHRLLRVTRLAPNVVPGVYTLTTAGVLEPASGDAPWFARPESIATWQLREKPARRHSWNPAYLAALGDVERALQAAERAENPWPKSPRDRKYARERNAMVGLFAIEFGGSDEAAWCTAAAAGYDVIAIIMPRRV
jgi:hypothetical protein